MPRLTIDNQAVEVPAGATILEAARALGVEIPTLCFHAGHPPNTSCMLCLVKVAGRWAPSCATAAEDGMQVESETEEVRQLRRTGLELLLSHHQGDCSAPCEHACPLHLDIPLMLEQVADDDLVGAIATIRREMALPSIMGRVCGDLCEKACRRKEVDSPAAICLVKRFVADADLASAAPYLPPRASATGRSVAVLGTGPAGLSAAYHLLLAGHDCTLLDARAEPGGMLREIPEHDLPRHLLDREIALLGRLGARFELAVSTPFADLQTQVWARFDAVLLTEWPGSAPVSADHVTHQTGTRGLFAAGEVIRPVRQPARLLADGKQAARCIDLYLRTGSVAGSAPDFHVRAGRLPREEIVALTVRAGSAARVAAPEGPEHGLSLEQAREEARRCLHCDCGAHDSCRLRRYAVLLGAQPARYRSERRSIERHSMPGRVVYEPGKCILCGICVQIATAAREPLGLTFIGRGFDVRVAAPWDRPIAEGLVRTGEECVQACPTGALSRVPGAGEPCFSSPAACCLNESAPAPSPGRDRDLR